MNKETTLKKLINNRCFCLKEDADINIEDCRFITCKRWKKCMTKANKDIERDLKRTRREKNGKASQKKRQI